MVSNISTGHMEYIEGDISMSVHEDSTIIGIIKAKLALKFDSHS